MMKAILLMLLSLTLINCGSRKRNVRAGSAETESRATASGSSNVSLKTSVAGEMNFSDFLENRNLKITANGSPYHLQYGGMTLTGTADLELSENKQEKKFLYKYIIQTIYQSQTTYYRHTRYNTETTYRTVDIQRAGVSWSNMVAMLISTFIAGAVFWPLIKTFLPKWKINIV